MWQKEHSVVTVATKKQVWKIWTDVANWHLWDSEVEWATLKGEFKAGSHGYLKPKDGPKTKFILLSSEPLKGFLDRSFLPLAKVDFIHKMEQTSDGLKVTHRIEISGPLSFFFAKVIGEKVVHGLPVAMRNLIALAEKGSASQEIDG